MTPDGNGKVVTFYSYKGGAGRTMLLASCATLLSRWGFSVLCVDWDLEAPGLHLYLRGSTNRTPQRRGLARHVQTFRAGGVADWRDEITQVTLSGGESLDAIFVGSEVDESALTTVNWEDLYDNRGFGNHLEEVRNEWTRAYDYVLIDSRTGISDTTGVCTVHLPDTLVLCVNPNEQAMSGTERVIARSLELRHKLPFDRATLQLLPIPTRFESRVEYAMSERWLQNFVERFGDHFDSWRDKSVASQKIATLVKIPYVPFWSYGEQIPVLTESGDDPASISYAFETVAALLVSNLGRSGELANDRDRYVRLASASRSSDLRIQLERARSADTPDEAVDTIVAALRSLENNSASTDVSSFSDGVADLVRVISGSDPTRAVSLTETILDGLADAGDAKVDRARASIANAAANSLEGTGRSSDVIRLSELAVNALRDAATSSPRDQTLRASLVTRLMQLAGQQRGNGRIDEALDAAREASELSRRLAAAQPDRFRPNLAHTLDDLGGYLGAIGDRESALEATREATGIYRVLAAEQPDDFRPDLARSLSNLGIDLSARADYEAALDAAREGVDIYRTLADTRPDAFQASLASALTNLGNRFSAIGDHEAALEAAREAIEIYRVRESTHPGTLLGPLASSLTNLGVHLSATENQEDALQADREALEIRRALVAARPDAFSAELALALHNLGADFSEIEDHESALELVREAVEIRRELAHARPAVFDPDLANSLRLLAVLYRALGQTDEAMQRIAEADSLDPTDDSETE